MGVLKIVLTFWDERKREANLRTHELDFADVRDRFDWNTARVVQSYPAPDGRARFAAIGRLDGRLVTLVFSPLGSEAISVISLRVASRTERKSYAQE